MACGAPYGNDPRVAVSQGNEAAWEVSEVQVLKCEALWHANYTLNTFTSDVNFTLTFRQQTTRAISVNATAYELRAALEALPNVGKLRVAVNNSVEPYTFATETAPPPGEFATGKEPLHAETNGRICDERQTHYTIVVSD